MRVFPMSPVAAVIVSVLSSLSLSAAEGWLTDFEKAKAAAQASKKDILMDFTGSDWCGWCIRLRKEVFDTKEFKEAAPRSFVLLEVDFPQDKSKITPKEQEQNDKLQSQFGVEGFPTIFLADAQGRPYAQLSYEKGGPENYLQLIEKSRQIRVKRDDAFGRASSAAGLDKAKALRDGLQELPEPLVATHYQKVLAEIKSLDAGDSLGMDAKYGFVAELKGLEGRLREKIASGGEGLRAEADAFLKEHPKATAAQKQQALFGVLSFLRPPKDNAVALKLMQDVLALDPASETGKRASELKGRIEAMIQKQPGGGK
jgi:thioredoxin-related protein